MYQMEAIRPSIERLSLAIANSLRLEIAIFDRDQLFFCTPTYLKKKDRTVHSPSIQEVMNSGSVLVNTRAKCPPASAAASKITVRPPLRSCVASGWTPRWWGWRR